MWPKEDIPDTDLLLMRVHIKTHAAKGMLSLGALQNRDGGMSTDWNKYATPSETRSRGRRPKDEYAVIQMQVGEVRAVPNQVVEHTPIYPTNRAHTEVFGEKDEEVRVLLKRCAAWAIPPSQENVNKPS